MCGCQSQFRWINQRTIQSPFATDDQVTLKKKKMKTDNNKKTKNQRRNNGMCSANNENVHHFVMVCNSQYISIIEFKQDNKPIWNQVNEICKISVCYHFKLKVFAMLFDAKFVCFLLFQFVSYDLIFSANKTARKSFKPFSCRYYLIFFFFFELNVETKCVDVVCCWAVYWSKCVRIEMRKSDDSNGIQKKNDLICRLETERVHWMDYLNSNYRKFQTHYSSEFIHIKRRPRPTAKFSKFNFLIIKFCCFSFQIIFVCAKQDETITQSHDFTFLNVRVCACVVYLL